MSEDQPHFRFNPGAYAEGRSFESSRETCEVCSRPCVWKYTSSIYGPDLSTLCARCIASGALGRHLAGDYGLHDIVLEGAEPSLEEELLQRTPGIASFNPFEWPVLDAKPLGFVGYGEDESLLAIEAVQTAMDAAWREVGETFDGPTPYMLIFKEIDGERYRAVLDID